jgi:hypothetical protein
MVRTALVTAWILLLSASAAVAYPGQDGGQGTYGEADDKVVTLAGFILIAGFPVLVFLLSMLQRSLERRKDRRKAAEKARRARADARGGW